MFKRFFANFATPGLLIGIALVMGALYGADRFLATLERRELSAQAGHIYQQGEALMNQGRVLEAVEAFRQAHVLQRDNRYYELALASALISAHQPERAIDTLQDALLIDSNDGPANLIMARAMVEEQKPRAAASFFHRAIYGTWPPAEHEKPVEARLELVNFLFQSGDEQALLAEIIPLEEEAKSDDAIAHQLPALYLRAGSLQRAEDAYRRLIRKEPDNADAYSGLARVELEKGNFHAAEQSFAAAAHRKPDDPRLKAEVEVARTAQSLDPSSRRLTSREKLSRSNQILALAHDTLLACGAQPEGDSLLDQAKKMLTQNASGAASNEMAEARLDLAEQIWKQRPAACYASPDQTGILGLLMRKIAQ